MLHPSVLTLSLFIMPVKHLNCIEISYNISKRSICFYIFLQENVDFNAQPTVHHRDVALDDLRIDDRNCDQATGMIICPGADDCFPNHALCIMYV